MSTPDIFLSYSREDAARAKQFADALAKEGFEVWWDAHLRSGEDYDKVTEDALKTARAVVVLWSKHSADSRWVRAEATIAHRKKTLMPAMIEGCDRPVMFELTQTAELSHWKGDRSDRAWKAFVGDLRKHIGREATAAPAEAAPAPAQSRPVASSRRNLVLAAIAAAVVLLAAGAAWLVFGRSESGARTAAHAGERVPVLVRTFIAGGSADKNTAELASGLSDELVVRLRQVPELRIGGGNVGAASGGVFGNAYVVDGNVQRDGDRARVTARLLDHGGEVVWSQSYDRTMSDLFAMQEQIAAAIASALSVSLDVGANSSKYGGTDNPDAFAAFMQFRAHQFSYDQSVPRGYLERAIALDPHYVAALNALSASYGVQLAYASTKAEQNAWLAKMDASTRQMVAANPNDWKSHASRAVFEATRGDLVGAKKEMDREQALDPKTDPGLPASLMTMDFMLGYRTKASGLAQSVEIIDPTYRNDPDVIRYDLYTSKYDEATKLFDELAQQGNEGRRNHALEVFWAYMLLGREADAIAFANHDGDEFGKQAVAFKADKVLPTLTMPELRQWAAAKYGDGKQFDIANTALLASYYGHPGLAVNLMRLAFERPGAVAYLDTWQPAFANARKTDAFAKLMDDFGFVKVWRMSGDWGDYCQPAANGQVACH